MRGLAAACLTALALFAPCTVSAQEAGPAPIMTVDQDRLYAASLWGKRVQTELETASQTLQDENRRLEADLTAEEKALTDKRATLPADEFRKLADAFDARVTTIRKERDTKVRDLNALQDEERRRFFEAAVPIMGQVMEKKGAFAVLDARAVILSVKAIDATDVMLQAIDSQLGDGKAAPAP